MVAGRNSLVQGDVGLSHLRGRLLAGHIGRNAVGIHILPQLGRLPSDSQDAGNMVTSLRSDDLVDKGRTGADTYDLEVAAAVPVELGYEGLEIFVCIILGTDRIQHDSNTVIGVEDYKDDMVKYARDDDKPYIRGCFDSITKQLAKDYKKFQYNLIKKDGRAEEYVGSLQWLEDAGMIRRCYNTAATGLPIEGNAIESVFKVYMTDIGLLVTMLGGSTRSDILQGNLGGFKGAIYENLMADTLHKKGHSLYYYRKESGMELDFLISYKGECVPVEVKAKTAKAKSLSTALKHPDNYHIFHAIKFGDYNVGREGQLLTLPNYMQFLLDLEPEEIVLEPIDVDAVNALAKKILG